MNRVISSIVLLVSGVIISYLSSNILFSVIGCSVISLILNRELFMSGGDNFFDSGIPSSEILQGFQTFKDYVNIHDYQYDDYKDTVVDSVFIDAGGHIWSLGLESLEWYLLVDDEWIRNEPQYKMIMVSESEFFEMETS